LGGTNLRVQHDSALVREVGELSALVSAL
jgi:hypothetical protein